MQANQVSQIVLGLLAGLALARFMSVARIQEEQRVKEEAARQREWAELVYSIRRAYGP